MPKKSNRTRGKSKDELLQNKESISRSDGSHSQNTSNDNTFTSSSSSSSSSRRNKKDKKGTPELISMSAVQNNMHELHKIRVFSSISSGITAGILDLKGLYGFALFIIVFIITSLLMFIKMKMSINQYFRPITSFITTSLWDATMSFVLFWTFFANILYLYG